MEDPEDFFEDISSKLCTSQTSLSTTLSSLSSFSLQLRALRQTLSKNSNLSITVPTPIFSYSPSTPTSDISTIKSEVQTLKQVVNNLIDRIVYSTQNIQDHIIKTQASRLKCQSTPERKSDPTHRILKSSDSKFLTFPGQSVGLYITTVRSIQTKPRQIGQQESNMPFLSNSVINWTGSLRSFPKP